MTARPIMEGEREKLLERLQREALWQENHYEGAPCAPLLRAAHEALLSTSAAVRGMREALGVEMVKWVNDVRVLYPDNEVLESFDRLRAALSGIEPGEDEQ